MTATTLGNDYKKIFEETFLSPFEKDTEDNALRVLESIRQAHPSSSGWIEIEGYAEKLSNGKWRAVRKHAQFKRVS